MHPASCTNGTKFANPGCIALSLTAESLLMQAIDEKEHSSTAPASSADAAHCRAQMVKVEPGGTSASVVHDTPLLLVIITESSTT